MIGQYIFKKIILSTMLLASILASSSLLAGGFQINEHSVSGLGRSYAGEAAMVENASTIARNPAAMSYFADRSLSIMAHYIAPDVDVEGTNLAPGTAFTDDASTSNIVPSAFLPSIYYVAPIDDKWAFGLALTTHFGLSSDYPNKFGGSEHGDKIALETIYLTPSVSYKVNEKVSVGLGLSYIMGDGEYTTTASKVANDRIDGIEATAPEVGDPLLDLKSDGTGFGWNLGVMWQINEISRFGFRYMAASDIDTDATFRRYDISTALTQPSPYIETQGTLTLNLPEVVELAYSIQLTRRLMLAASLQQTAWSSFEGIKVDDTVILEADWDDTTRYSVGADYQLGDGLVIRAGYAVDESPVSDQNRTLAIPDTDKNFYSIGATFELARGSLDMGMSYILGDSGEIKESYITEGSSGNSLTVSEFEGEVTDLEAWIYSIAYNVTF